MDYRIQENFRRYLIPEGEAGAKAKVRIIWNYIKAGWSDPNVIRQAEDIVRWLPERDQDAEASAIYEWARKNGRYTRERVEKIKSAGYQLTELKETGRITGDCDDATVLISALAGAIGIKVRTLVLPWSHIYPEALIKGKWASLDIVGAEAYYGRDIPGKKIIAQVAGLEGIGGIGMPEMMISPDVKVDDQGNVYKLEGGFGKKGGVWKKIGKVVKKIGKVALPVVGLLAAGAVGGIAIKGMVERVATRAEKLKAKQVAAKARGNTIIVDKFGNEVEVPTAQATSTMITAAKEEEKITEGPIGPSAEEAAAPVVGEKKETNYLLYGALALGLLMMSRRKAD